MGGTRPGSGGDIAVVALEAASAPKGPRAHLDEAAPGCSDITEGLAVYLNGTDLPGEIYASSGIDELIAALSRRLGAESDMQSWWHGPRETALYRYGRPPRG